MEKITIYEEKCNEALCKELLHGLDLNYSLDYLNQFFEEKVKKYFTKEIEAEEKSEGEEDSTPYYDEYIFALRVKQIFEELKRFKDYGYEFEILEISAADWYIDIIWDNTKLTKEQRSIVDFFIGERF